MVDNHPPFLAAKSRELDVLYKPRNYPRFLLIECGHIITVTQQKQLAATRHVWTKPIITK